MSKQPSYGSRDYWDKRFTANTKPFDWLEAPTVLDRYLVDALRNTHDDPEILHIGCGTSLLSYHLRAHVEDPQHIHNLDYSEVAIEWGKQRERDMFQVSDGEDQEGVTEGVPKLMRWSAVNLLSQFWLLNICPPSSYSVIVDKSTSDAIACSEDVYVPLPYPLSIGSRTTTVGPSSNSPEPVHPLQVLAVHLALLAKAKARWISVSYSSDRYPFLSLPTAPHSAEDSSGSKIPGQTTSSTQESDLEDGVDDIPLDMAGADFPDPRTLWKLTSRHEIDVPEPADIPETNPVHRPKVQHWVYILERTNVEVHIRK